MWQCSECDFENDLDPEVEEGQVLGCAECGGQFEVLSLDPLELNLVGESVTVDADDVEEAEEEDWEE